MNDVQLILATSAAAGGFTALAVRPALETFRIADQTITGTLRAEMLRAGMDPAPLTAWLLTAGLIAAGLATVLILLGLPPLAIVGAAIVLLATPPIIRYAIASTRRRVNLQVVGAARNLSGQVRVGLPLSQAMASAARETPTPLGRHLKNVTRLIEQGETVRQALANLKRTVQVESVAALAVALQVADERGGKLSDVLDRLAFTAEEIARVERKRESNIAGGRLMILLMAAFPFAFTALIALLDPEMIRPLFRSLPGQVILAVVVSIIYVSLRWAGRILTPKV